VVNIAIPRFVYGIQRVEKEEIAGDEEEYWNRKQNKPNTSKSWHEVDLEVILSDIGSRRCGNGGLLTEDDIFPVLTTGGHSKCNYTPLPPINLRSFSNHTFSMRKENATLETSRVCLIQLLAQGQFHIPGETFVLF
jgi:hypothetical protein